VEGFAAIVTVVTKVLFTVNIVALISAPEEGVIVIVPVVAPAGNVAVI
jgi:hypothetical protein